MAAKTVPLDVLMLFIGPKCEHQFPGPWFEFFSVAAVTTPLPMLLLLLPMLLLLLPQPPPWHELQLLLPPYVCICV